MLSDTQFLHWCQQIRLSPAAQALISQIRAAPPARHVRSRAGNVSGRYPSRKMGVTIQFESHRVELAAIYAMEHDPEVFEFYDQPPPLRLQYQVIIRNTCYSYWCTNRVGLHLLLNQSTCCTDC